MLLKNGDEKGEGSFADEDRMKHIIVFKGVAGMSTITRSLSENAFFPNYRARQKPLPNNKPPLLLRNKLHHLNRYQLSQSESSYKAYR